MKITDQIQTPDRSRVIIIENNASPELSEFLEHIQNRINLDYVGTGSPEGVVSANIGSTYRRLDGGASTSFYVKETGTDENGWARN